MNKKVYLNGEFVDSQLAKVSVFDRGFLFSDSVYEVVHVDSNKLFLFEEHLLRLKRSLFELKISEPKENLLKICRELLSFHPVEYGGIYIQVTRGTQEQRSHFWNNQNLTPNIIAFTQAGKRPDKKALRAITFPDLRWGRCDIKSTSLLANILAREEAALKSADEALLLTEDGFVNEGSSTNVFIFKKGKAYTPPLSANILAGITRRFCIVTLQEMGIECLEEKIRKEDLFSAEEVWITSSTKDVLPIGTIDDQDLSFRVQNSLWEKLYENFKQRKLKALN